MSVPLPQLASIIAAERTACAKAVCWRCKDGQELKPGWKGSYLDGSFYHVEITARGDERSTAFPCFASGIHARSGT